MFVTNRLLLLLLFFLATRLLLVVDTAHAKATSNHISYSPLNPDKPAIDVGSSVTTDDASSWMSSSGRFSFGFYRENDNFSVGIQLLISPSETVVVWTARPDLKRFSKDAFLNFTRDGLFVTPGKGANAFLLYEFSSTATSADMLDDGNFVVYGNISDNSNVSSTMGSIAAAGPGKTYNRISYNSGCKKSYYCRSASDSTIWRSFDFATDTILENQILPCGYNLTSSAGNTNHSNGKYILNLPCDGANLISYQLSADKNWDSGVSVGDNSSLNLDGEGRLYLISSGGYEKDLSGYKPNKISIHDDMLYRATLDSDGLFRVYELNLNNNSTRQVNEIPYYKDICQAKDNCGGNSYCLLVSSNAQCNCMPGFEYIDQRSQFAGCRRNKTVPSCIGLGSAADAATIFSMERVDNIAGMVELAYGVVSTASQEECRISCLNDCICDAASFIDQKCFKLKLPLTSVRKDESQLSVTFIKLAAGGTAGPGRRREICFAAIFISAAVTISIWIVVIAAFVGAYWLLFVRFRKEWRKWELALTEEIAPRYFSYEELRKGSNEFNQSLGKGGHGTVYRAELPIGDRTVAVALKKLHGAEMEGAEREFQAEMSLIGRACHANLVRLVGFCHNGPSRIIAYELMSRGSLANHIFESRGRRPSWERRIAILIDAARGIHYLHSECDTKIIHRDIKPENILISENWTAKIADFGLAKLLNINQTRAATQTLAAGTEGYVAPECEQVFDETGEAQVTEKADVYSYGIVVLETICSKRNREVRLSLRELVRKSYEANELSKLVDREEVPEAIELEKLVKVGLLCVQEDPNARPFMEDVVMMLEGYVDVPTPLPTVPLSL